MNRPLTRLLVKVVAKGFYQEHTGLLLTLFIVIFSNFFYTSVLNQTHLTQEGLIQNALKLVLTTVSEPLGVVFLFSLFLLYTGKSWQYVADRLKRVDVQFLFYSTNALGWGRQLASWAALQLVVSLPIIGLGVFALLIGVAFGYWLVPLLIPFYLLALTFSSAWYYTRLLNTTVGPATVDHLGWLRRWPKPLFSLFLYEVMVNKRLTYAMTKGVSFASIAFLVRVLPDAKADVRLVGLISLCVALSHVILLYQSAEFEGFYLRFARNFPYGLWDVWAQQGAMYSVLLLPEFVWLFVEGKLYNVLIGALLLLSVTLLFRALLYGLSGRMDYYLRTVGGLFAFYFLMILFGYTALLAVGNLVAAWVLVYCYRDGSFA